MPRLRTPPTTRPLRRTSRRAERPRRPPYRPASSPRGRRAGVQRDAEQVVAGEVASPPAWPARATLRPAARAAATIGVRHRWWRSGSGPGPRRTGRRGRASGWWRRARRRRPRPAPSPPPRSTRPPSERSCTARNLARPDQAADEVAVAALELQVDRRRRAVLAAEQLAQIEAGAQLAVADADQQQRVAGLHRGEVGAPGIVGDQADGADGRRRRNGRARRSRCRG